MCVLDYKFHILDNAFLVISPASIRPAIVRDLCSGRRTNGLINKKISREMRMMYGSRSGCVI
ncbi:GD22097 [Drosophila simulans]|uniref:GD22097 n=1 Tax=Drosophila simulans TaxID=7240 RepID=B4Q496_DROSI|nr:GD22097 [Drosophila simulans]